MNSSKAEEHHYIIEVSMAILKNKHRYSMPDAEEETDVNRERPVGLDDQHIVNSSTTRFHDCNQLLRSPVHAVGGWKYVNNHR